MSLIAAAGSVLAAVRSYGHDGCLVGGLAVSVRCDPRFTRDVDLAVTVAGDADAEVLIRSLIADELSAQVLVEQEDAGRLAMVRLTDRNGISIDMLLASSGIEAEIVSAAESIEVVNGVRMPVARVGRLVAMKLLSVGAMRETDSADLRSLASVATMDDWSLAAEAVALIQLRGFARGRRLVDDLERLRATS